MVWVCGRCGYEVPEGEIGRYVLSEEELLEHAKNLNEEDRIRLLTMGAWRCPNCGRVLRPLMRDEAFIILARNGTPIPPIMIIKIKKEAE